LLPWRRYRHAISRSFNLVVIAIRLAVCWPTSAEAGASIRRRRPVSDP
jgi:hypothetical protein